MRGGAGRVLLALLLAAPLAGCTAAPHALGWHDTGIEQSLPLRGHRTVWAGVPLDDLTRDPIVLRSLRLTGVHGFHVGPAVVVEVLPGGRIDWYAPPGTGVMKRQMAHPSPLAGFTIPPRTKDRFQAVVLLTATSPGRPAWTTGAEAEYTTGGRTWTEAWGERSRLRLGG